MWFLKNVLILFQQQSHIPEEIIIVDQTPEEDRPSEILVGVIGIGAGVVDRGYTGEIFVNLHNINHRTQTFHAGDKIAQAVLVKITTDIELVEAENIPLTVDYDILYNKDNKWHEESQGRFLDIIGNILFDIIEEGLENDQISFNTEDRNDNTE